LELLREPLETEDNNKNTKINRQQILKHEKSPVFGPLGRLRVPLGVLGSLGGGLWGAFGRLGVSLGVSWGVLGVSWGVFWEALGGSLGGLGGT